MTKGQSRRGTSLKVPSAKLTACKSLLRRNFFTLFYVDGTYHAGILRHAPISCSYKMYRNVGESARTLFEPCPGPLNGLRAMRICSLNARHTNDTSSRTKIPTTP